MSALDFARIFVAAQAGETVRVRFPDEISAARYRFQVLGWKKRDKKINGDRFANVGLYMPKQLYPGLIVIVAHERMHLVTELAGGTLMAEPTVELESGASLEDVVLPAPAGQGKPHAASIPEAEIDSFMAQVDGLLNPGGE